MSTDFEDKAECGILNMRMWMFSYKYANIQLEMYIFQIEKAKSGISFENSLNSGISLTLHEIISLFFPSSKVLTHGTDFILQLEHEIQ